MVSELPPAPATPTRRSPHRITTLLLSNTASTNNPRRLSKGLVRVVCGLLGTGASLRPSVLGRFLGSVRASLRSPAFDTAPVEMAAPPVFDKIRPDVVPAERATPPTPLARVSNLTAASRRAESSSLSPDCARPRTPRCCLSSGTCSNFRPRYNTSKCSRHATCMVQFKSPEWTALTSIASTLSEVKTRQGAEPCVPTTTGCRRDV